MVSVTQIWATLRSLFTLEQRLSLQMSALQDSVSAHLAAEAAFLAEVQTDVSAILGQVSALQAQVASLQADAVDQASLDSLNSATQNLTEQTAALHVKVTPNG